VSTAAGQRPGSLEYRLDGGTPRAVMIRGANAAGTGIVGDGSGVKGPTAVVSDNTSDTAAALATIGANYLSTQRSVIRGTVTAEELTPSTYNTGGNFFRPGCTLTLTDASVGASGNYMVTEVTKRFYASGKEDWTVSFGGIPPSGTRLMRRLTRATLS
jgi:hypothetical protein